MTEENITESTSENTDDTVTAALDDRNERKTRRDEAAKYRTRLREAEERLAESDRRNKALRYSVLGSHDFVATVPGPHGSPQQVRLSQMLDLFGFGNLDIDDAVSEDGQVNRELIEESLVRLYEQRPGLFEDTKPRLQPIPGEGKNAPMPLDLTNLDAVLKRAMLGG